MIKSGMHFLVDRVIGFRKILSTLGMTENHIFAADVLQHSWSNFTGKGAFFFPMHVLCAYSDIGSFQRFFHSCQ